MSIEERIEKEGKVFKSRTSKRLTAQERIEARDGCQFYHNGYCVHDIKGKTWCVCLQVARKDKAKTPNPE